MRGNYYVTLEELGHGSSLEVQILYEYTPGEPMVRYYPDGSGYPGSPPDVEFISCHVFRWGVWNSFVTIDERKRDSSWVWESLDRIAERIIRERWEHFRVGCLEDAAELSRERCEE